MITSVHNPKLQHVRSLLTQRKDRKAAQEFVIEGVRLAEEALASNWLPKFVLHTSELSPRGQELLARFHDAGCEIEGLTPSLMESLSGTESPQGILAVLPMRELPLPPDPTLLLIADAIRDPGNLGTLLRSAAASGVQAVILAPGTTDPYSPKVVRSAMGAHFRLPVRSLDWDAIAALCKPRLWVLLAEAAQGTPAWQLNLRQPLALIVGGEAEGASRTAAQLADTLITIPMPGESESLNAAMAGSILLFEIVRQRSS
jgi:TrmH family RNA methyltransferase